MIELQGIFKTFRVSKREAGFGNAVKALFHKEYSYVHALQDVSFSIGEGEMVGYIGPNGAGKSSTIKVMSGILTPDAGQCRIDGLVPWKDRKEHVRQIGVVFGQRSQLWWDVPIVDSFELIRDIYEVDAKAYKRNVDELTEMLDLSEILKNLTVLEEQKAAREAAEAAARAEEEARILADQGGKCVLLEVTSPDEYTFAPGAKSSDFERLFSGTTFSWVQLMRFPTRAGAASEEE